MAGVNIVHVPYKGGGPAMPDVVGGHTKIMFSLAGADDGSCIKSGQLRALGTGGSKRSSGAARRADHRGGRLARL